MKKLIAVLALAVVALAACGDDDGGGSDSTADAGDAEAFCDRLVELDEGGFNLSDEEAFGSFEELVELAPEAIDSETLRIQRAFDEVSELDEDDPDSVGAAFEIILDPALNRALEDFRVYAEDECGVEVEGAESFGDLSDDMSSGFSDDVPDGDLSSAQQLRAFLDENHPDYSDLAQGIGTVDVSADELQVTLTLSETTDGDTAVAICEATLDWGEDAELVEIEIEVEDQEDTVLATGGFEDGCEAA